jgi:nucleotide-binding universal stress UspA family protein
MELAIATRSVERELAPVPAARLAPPPFGDVLCAVNGSRGSDAAMRQAIGLALHPARLEFIAISDLADVENGEGAGDGNARDALIRAAARAEKAGIRSSTTLRRGSRLSDLLLAEGAERDLLVVGCHAGPRAARVVLGGTVTEIAYRARQPLLIARRTVDEGNFPSCVLLATDGSPGSWAAARTAAQLAKARGSELRIAFVADGNPERHRDLFRQLTTIEREAGTAPIVVESSGDPGERIAQAARACQASLIAIGRHGAASRKTLGSVTERVVRRAPSSVLLVP